jgi:hypothetical protein
MVEDIVVRALGYSNRNVAQGCLNPVDQFWRNLLSQVRLVHDTQVGAPGCQYRVYLVARRQVAAHHRRDACLIAYPIAQRRQKASPEDRLAL